MKTKSFTLYADPGHAWLKVPFSLLEQLGIADKISSYSYMLGQFAYLEEDCDLSIFCAAMRDAGIQYRINERSVNSNSTIRTYRQYSRNQFHAMPQGTPGELIEYGGTTYQIVASLGRRGFEVIHYKSGLAYRLPRKFITSAKKADL